MTNLVKKIVTLFLLLFLLGTGFPQFSRNALGQSSDALKSLQDQIQQYLGQIDRLQSQANTLKNQIAQFDAQIRLTQLKIAETEEKITLLGGRIDQLEFSLDSLTEAFSSRANETYKMARISHFFIFLVSSVDLSEAVTRFHYLQKIQEADRDLLVRLQEAQDTYTEEKTDQEELQEELQLQKANLDTQKRAKTSLLTQTRNDERKFQQLLAQALAERAALERALVEGVEVGPVSTGDPIGLVGNSGYPGCSTGKHLHFEVRKGGSWVDPAGYLSGKTVIDEQNGGGNTNIGSGSWPWPIQDTIRLTQHYGNTPYSWQYKYSGGIHTGLDLVSKSSDVIRAPANGTLYRSSQSCGSSTINIVYIDHGNDLISFYLHVQ